MSSFLAIGRPVLPKAKFDVPHQTEPMRFQKIQTEFPEFAKIFDGEAEENTLLFYQKQNKQRGVQEFKDVESEEEVAELMGVKIVEIEEALKEEEDEHEARSLTEEEINVFHEHMADIRKGREWLDQKKQ